MSGIKVYIAAPWTHRHTDAAKAHESFTAAGFICTSDWTTRKIVGDEHSSDVLRHEALSDINGLEHAEVFVIMNLGKSEGKATELGYALAMEIPVVLIGERKINVFYHLPQVKQVKTVLEAITAIEEMFS